MTKAVFPEPEVLKWVKIGGDEYATEIMSSDHREGVEIIGVVITNKKGGICWLPGVSMSDVTYTIREDNEP